MGVSRTLAVAEAALVLLPLTLFALWGVPLAAFAAAVSVLDGGADPALPLFALGSALGLVGLCGAWVLMIAFIRGGPQALVGAPTWAWWLALAGAVVAIAGGVELALHGGPMLALGLFALVPLVHLVFERRRSAGHRPQDAPAVRNVT